MVILDALFSDTVPPSDRDEQYSFVEAVNCRSANYLRDRNNKIVKGVLLNVRHCTQGGGNKKVNFWNNQFTANSNNSRQRISQAGGYDRIFTFGDLGSSKGRCFCIITTSSRDSDELFRFSKDKAVGDCFVIVEPTAKNFISPGVPVLQSNFPLLPIKDTGSFLEPIKFMRTEWGQTRFFVMKGKKIVLSTAMAVSNNVSCSGFFCDRQNVMPSVYAKCGCFYKQGSGGFVINGDLQVKVDEKMAAYFDINSGEVLYEDFNDSNELNNNSNNAIDLSGTNDNNNKKKDGGRKGDDNNDESRGGEVDSHYIDPMKCLIISNYRSWRTTKLFLRNINTSLDVANYSRSRLRLSVNGLVDYVNKNGGWTIVAWYRQGMVADVGGNEKDKADEIYNITQKLHVNYLFPTTINVRSNDFRQHQFCENGSTNVATARTAAT